MGEGAHREVVTNTIPKNILKIYCTRMACNTKIENILKILKVRKIRMLYKNNTYKVRKHK